jgi:hypothetical protein
MAEQKRVTRAATGLSCPSPLLVSPCRSTTWRCRSCARRSAGIRCARLRTKGNPSGRSAQRPGTQRSRERVWETSAGTTFATHGHPGTCRAERRSLRFRSSRVGRPRRWCDVMRTLPRSIWRSTPPTRKVTATNTAQITGLPRHSPIASGEELIWPVVCQGLQASASRISCSKC